MVHEIVSHSDLREPCCWCVVILECWAFFKIWRGHTSLILCVYTVMTWTCQYSIRIDISDSRRVWLFMICISLWTQVSCSSTWFSSFWVPPSQPLNNQGLGGAVWLPARTCRKHMRADFWVYFPLICFLGMWSHGQNDCKYNFFEQSSTRISLKDFSYWLNGVGSNVFVTLSGFSFLCACSCWPFILTPTLPLVLLFTSMY